MDIKEFMDKKGLDYISVFAFNDSLTLKCTIQRTQHGEFEELKAKSFQELIEKLEKYGEENET